MKNNWWLVAIAVLCLIPSAWLLSKGFGRKPAGEYISVTGMSEVNFASDLIVWSADFSRSAFDLKQAYQELKADKDRVGAFLKKQGMHDSEVIFNTINVQQLFDYQYDGERSKRVFQGYKISQTVTLKSSRVALVENISKESMSLIEQGLEFNSNNPEFYYTKLSSLKISLIEKATADARLRAEKIASAAGSKLGALKKATLGVFQITGQFDDVEYSWGGVFNTSSRLKTARVTITANYLAD